MKTELQTMVDYIEDNLSENITLDQISNYVGYSKYYLNRIFSIYTGISIIDYVRKRKLNAGMRELQGNKNILDIAFDYGYTSERAFSRAFLKEFGHSPSYYRKNVLPYKEKLSIFDLNLGLTREALSLPLHPELDNNVNRKGVSEIMKFLSDIKYVTLANMTVLSATLYGNEPEEEVINLIHDFAKENNIHPLREFGFDVPVEGDKPTTEYRGYEIWISISEEDQQSLIKSNRSFKEDGETQTFSFKENTITVKEIPICRYASLRITNPFEDPFTRIPAGWKALIGWLETNEFKEHKNPNTFNGYCLEEVTEENGIIYMDIYIPVESL
jgi:AraC family transcriptional regulator